MDLKDILKKFLFLDLKVMPDDGCHWFIDVNYEEYYSQIGFSKHYQKTEEEAKLEAIRRIIKEAYENLRYYKGIGAIDKLNFRTYLKNIEENEWLDKEEYKEIFSEFKEGYPIVKLFKENITISEFEYLREYFKTHKY